MTTTNHQKNDKKESKIARRNQEKNGICCIGKGESKSKTLKMSTTMNKRIPLFI